jgi:hypothetical protein
MAQTAQSLVACNPAGVLFIPADISKPIRQPPPVSPSPPTSDARCSCVAVPYDEDDANTGSVGCVTKYANAHFSSTFSS